MKKYGTPEKLEVFRGEELQVLSSHIQKTGKKRVSDFSEQEKRELRIELESLGKEEDEQSPTNESA